MTTDRLYEAVSFRHGLTLCMRLEMQMVQEPPEAPSDQTGGVVVRPEQDTIPAPSAKTLPSRRAA